jgi:murein DD-endopeptidase MepM/ murein hydrolase activator NlpD
LPATAALPATDIPATATSSPTETPISCDPFAAEFCITDGHFVLQRPILPPANDSVERAYPFASTAAGTREAHHGVEFINGTGTPVYAAADGQVIFAGPDDEAMFSPWKKFYGNVVVIQHANDLYTLYAHLSKIDVETRQAVKTGEKIGEVGWTGAAIGSHLHFEARRGDGEDYFSAVNPELWLAPRADEGALSISIVNAQGAFQNAELTIQTDGRFYYIKTYEEVKSMEENAALGEARQGRYRITFYFGGSFYERWVDVVAGKLTQVVFVVK